MVEERSVNGFGNLSRANGLKIKSTGEWYNDVEHRICWKLLLQYWGCHNARKSKYIHQFACKASGINSLQVPGFTFSKHLSSNTNRIETCFVHWFQASISFLSVAGLESWRVLRSEWQTDETKDELKIIMKHSRKKKHGTWKCWWNQEESHFARIYFQVLNQISGEKINLTSQLANVGERFSHKSVLVYLVNVQCISWLLIVLWSQPSNDSKLSATACS